MPGAMKDSKNDHFRIHSRIEHKVIPKHSTPDNTAEFRHERMTLGRQIKTLASRAKVGDKCKGPCGII